MLPLASAMVMQFSHFASTPTVPDQPSVGAPGTEPLAPPPGSEAVVASRQGSRPMGYQRLAVATARTGMGCCRPQPLSPGRRCRRQPPKEPARGDSPVMLRTTPLQEFLNPRRDVSWVDPEFRRALLTVGLRFP